VAVVTGVSRSIGIGTAVARRLTTDGLRVFVSGWHPFDELREYDSSPADLDLPRLDADFTDPTAPARVVQAARDEYGFVDVVVANHAYSVRTPLDELSAEEIDVHLAVNVRGTLLLARELYNQHDGRPGGRFVGFTSGQHLGPMPDELAYAASKGAIHQITASLSAAMSEKGITVNTINPGPTDTGWAAPEVYQQVLMHEPSGRWGKPEDAARAVSWLVSEEAEWITGQVLNSEGGLRR
jgi:3-oxoacyl-[acyl-carrier protein] reductase